MTLEDPSYEAETEFRIETLHKVLLSHGYRNCLGFTLNFLTFLIKYLESVGALNNDFHYDVIERMYKEHPGLENMCEEIISIVADYKDIVYEMENR